MCEPLARARAGIFQGFNVVKKHEHIIFEWIMRILCVNDSEQVNYQIERNNIYDVSNAILDFLWTSSEQ